MSKIVYGFYNSSLNILEIISNKENQIPRLLQSEYIKLCSPVTTVSSAPVGRDSVCPEPQNWPAPDSSRDCPAEHDTAAWSLHPGWTAAPPEEHDEGIVSDSALWLTMDAF